MSTEKITSKVDMKGCPIVQVGFVVADAKKTSEEFTKMFGLGPWIFADDMPEKVYFHSKLLDVADQPCIRACVANFANLQIELIQPLWGQGTWGEYLEKYGDGAHHLSFGIVAKYEEMIAALSDRGVPTDISGIIGETISATYMDTTKLLGTRLELVQTPTGQPKLGQWGMSAKKAEPNVTEMAGRSVAQVGIVVRDVVAAAKNYEDIFGIGPWKIVSPADGIKGMGLAEKQNIDVWSAASNSASAIEEPSWFMKGIPMLQAGMDIKVAYCNWLGLELKLIQPLRGHNTYWEFMNTRGEGIHHLSFGFVDDYDALLSAFTKAGVGIEMAGDFADAGKFTIMDTTRNLGIYIELGKKPLGNESLI